MTRATLALAAVAVAVPAGGAAAAGPKATLTIRHQVRGCHAWSYNGSPYLASQVVTLRAGTTLTVIDDDIMPHRLAQKGGPVVSIGGAAMSHMGAIAHVRFGQRGTYSFATRAGEDYKGMTHAATKGADNVLRVVVRVS